MEYYPLRIPRFHRHENFYLTYMDLKSPLDDIKLAEMCRQGYFSEIITHVTITTKIFGTNMKIHTALECKLQKKIQMFFTTII